MGTDTVAGGAVGPAAPALRLLQAAVRAGHQPAARRDPRGAGDVDGIDDRAGGQPARAGARVVPADQHRRTRSSTTSSWRSCGTSATDAAFSVDDAADAVRPGARAATGLERAIDGARARSASDAVAAGYTILILSDRGVGPRARADPEPAGDAPACTITWCAQGTRTRCALVVESGDAREVHHCALLLGYGAGAVNPYLAFETLDDMIRQRHARPAITHDQAVDQLHPRRSTRAS